MDAFLAIGTNLGDRAAHLASALHSLQRLGSLTGISSVYETDPVGFEDQPAFLNMVVSLDTMLDPAELLEGIHRIEEGRGRERTFRNAPRTLDIDILLVGEQRIQQPGLRVPHPRMKGRAFVLVPLLELDPDRVDPETGTPYRDYLKTPATGVRRVMSGAELLETS